MKDYLQKEKCTDIRIIVHGSSAFFLIWRGIENYRLQQNGRRVFGLASERLLDVWLGTKGYEFLDVPYVFWEIRTGLSKADISSDVNSAPGRHDTICRVVLMTFWYENDGGNKDADSFSDYSCL